MNSFSSKPASSDIFVQHSSPVNMETLNPQISLWSLAVLCYEFREFCSKIQFTVIMMFYVSSSLLESAAG